MQVLSRPADAQQFRAGGGQLDEYRLHKVLGVCAVPCQRERMVEERARVPVVERAQGLAVAFGETGEQCPVEAIVRFLFHSEI